MKPLYFGCKNECGHYTFDTDLNSVDRKENDLHLLDGKLTPKETGHGKAAVHLYDDYTILAMHDYSVDARPGSNAMFKFPHNSKATPVESARYYFPSVMARIEKVAPIRVLSIENHRTVVETNLTKRWEDGVPHHPKSVALFKMLADLDYQYGNDFFGFKCGGDGDNGEHLMYLMDIMFERQDGQKKPT